MIFDVLRCTWIAVVGWARCFCGLRFAGWLTGYGFHVFSLCSLGFVVQLFGAGLGLWWVCGLDGAGGVPEWF